MSRLSMANDDSKANTDADQEQAPVRERGLLRLEKNSGLLRLAQLSLQDYEWRVGFFKDQEADRKVEESLARMMGDEASYVRPMDASESKIGPLGLWEKESVEYHIMENAFPTPISPSTLPLSRLSVDGPLLP